MFSNKANRALFLSDRRSFSTLMELSEQDEKTLAAMNTDKIDDFSEGLLMKRLSAARVHFKLLFDLQYDIFFKLYSDAYSLYPVGNREGWLENFEKIGSYFLDALPQEPGLADYYMDLTQYYVTVLRCKLKNMPAYTVKSKGMTESARPILYPNCFLESFNYNPSQVIDVLEKNSENTEDLKKELCHYLFYSLDHRVMTISLEKGVIDVLALCNGAYTVKEIIDKLHFCYDYDSDNCHYVKDKLFQQLYDNKWVYFS